MRKMYIQPKNEITEVNPSLALLNGSMEFGNDPMIGTGGDAPERGAKVY